MDHEIRSINDLIIDGILAREGDRFTNNPLDRGGATKYGITQRAWDEYQNLHLPQHFARVVSVEHIHEIDARHFYATMYCEPLAWIEDIELRDLVIDCSVNHGSDRATKWLQRAAGCVAIDGVIGPETRKLVNAHSSLYGLMLIARLKFYAEIVYKNPSQVVFLRGWINRACEFIQP